MAASLLVISTAAVGCMSQLHEVVRQRFTRISRGCHRLQAVFRDGGDSDRRRQELDERSGCVQVFGSDGDPGGEHRNFLNLGRQRSDKIYAGDGKQFADLLETDFGVSTRDHGADSLALDSLALAHDLADDPEARKHLGGKISAADAGRIRDGFSLQQRAFQRLHRSTVGSHGKLAVPICRGFVNSGKTHGEKKRSPWLPLIPKSQFIGNCRLETSSSITVANSSCDPRTRIAPEKRAFQTRLHSRRCCRGNSLNSLLLGSGLVSTSGHGFNRADNEVPKSGFSR